MADVRADALALLARRPYARRELLERLIARGHVRDSADGAVARLESEGLVDDLALARQWIATRAGARGRGPERAAAELAARGIDPATAARAWTEAVADGEVDEAEAHGGEFRGPWTPAARRAFGRADLALISIS